MSSFLHAVVLFNTVFETVSLRFSHATVLLM